MQETELTFEADSPPSRRLGAQTVQKDKSALARLALDQSLVNDDTRSLFLLQQRVEQTLPKKNMVVPLVQKNLGDQAVPKDDSSLTHLALEQSIDTRGVAAEVASICKEKRKRYRQEKVAVVFDAETSEGQLLVHALVESGRKVVSIATSLDRAKAADSYTEGQEVEVNQYDREALAQAIRGVDRVIFLTRYWERFENPVEESQAMQLIDACHDAGTSNLLFCSLEDTMTCRDEGLESQIVHDATFRGMKAAKDKAKEMDVHLNHMITSYVDSEIAKTSLCLISGENGKLIATPFFKEQVQVEPTRTKKTNEPREVPRFASTPDPTRTTETKELREVPQLASTPDPTRTKKTKEPGEVPRLASTPDPTRTTETKEPREAPQLAPTPHPTRTKETKEPSEVPQLAPTPEPTRTKKTKEPGEIPQLAPTPDCSPHRKQEEPRKELPPLLTLNMKPVQVKVDSKKAPEKHAEMSRAAPIKKSSSARHVHANAKKKPLAQVTAPLRSPIMEPSNAVRDVLVELLPPQVKINLRSCWQKFQRLPYKELHLALLLFVGVGLASLLRFHFLSHDEATALSLFEEVDRGYATAVAFYIYHDM